MVLQSPAASESSDLEMKPTKGRGFGGGERQQGSILHIPALCLSIKPPGAFEEDERATREFPIQCQCRKRRGKRFFFSHTLYVLSSVKPQI